MKSKKSVFEENEEILQILGKLPFPVAVVDGEGQVKVWNEKAEELFKIDAEKVLGNNIREISYHIFQNENGFILSSLENGEIKKAKNISKRDDTFYSEVLLEKDGGRKLFLSAKELIKKKLFVEIVFDYETFLNNAEIFSMLEKESLSLSNFSLTSNLLRNVIPIIAYRYETIAENISQNICEFIGEHSESLSLESKALLHKILVESERGKRFGKTLYSLSGVLGEETVQNLNEKIISIEAMIDAAFGGRVDITYALTDEIPYIYEKEGSIESFLVQFALLFSSFLTEKSKILIETGRDVDLKEKRIECYISARVSNTNPPPHNIEKMFSDIDNKQKEFLSLNLLKKKGVLEIFCRRTSIVFKYKLKGMDKIASFKEWRGETFSEGYGRILLIEEENALREAIRVNLERVGFTVLQAESLSKARKIIEATEGKFGLIISDYVLTDGNAVEFAKMNIEKISDRLLFLSSLSFKELGVDEELKDFRIDFLLKPFKRVDLIKKVKSLMEN